jgi:hypothetical protein
MGTVLGKISGLGVHLKNVGVILACNCHFMQAIMLKIGCHVIKLAMIIN